MRPISSINGRAPAKGYLLPLLSGSSNAPVDSTTYYWGGDVGAMLYTVYASAAVRIPTSGTIKGAFIQVIKNVNGTNENVPHFLRINDVTDISLGNMTWTTATDRLLVTNLNAGVVEGDLLAVKIVCPAWVTNPTGVRAHGYVYIE